MFIRLLAATVVGGIVYFLLGFVIYGLILDPMVMRPNMNEFAGLIKPEPDLILIVFANLIAALMLAYIFEALANIRTFVNGLKAGAVIGFLFALSLQLMFMAFWNLHKNFMPLVGDVVGSTILTAVGGGVIAQVLGMMSKSSSGAASAESSGE